MQHNEESNDTAKAVSAPFTVAPAHASDQSAEQHSSDNAQIQASTMPEEAQQLEGTIVLRDGSPMHMRPIRPDDSARLQAFHARLSAETIVFRFFYFVPQLASEAADRFTHVDYANRMAVVATVGSGADEQIVGVVRYERTGPATAEVAFVVADAWQGHGIATALLRHLAHYARSHGIFKFTAVTMANNAKMLIVFRTCGFPCTLHYSSGEVEAELDISREPAPPGQPLP